MTCHTPVRSMLLDRLVCCAFILMAGGTAAADPATDEEPWTEFQPAAANPRESTDTKREHRPLDLRLAGSAEWLFLTESDLKDTYGGIPLLGVECSVGIDREVRFFTAIGYGWATGDAYSGDPTFVDGEEYRLQTVSIRIGVLGNLSGFERLPVYLGLAFNPSWMEEQIPQTDGEGGQSERIHSGWGAGLRVSLVPEWRSADRRRAVGVEVGVGGSSGELTGSYQTHTVNLTGVSVRLYGALGL